MTSGPEDQATIKEETVASELTRNGEVIGYRHDDLEVDPPYLYPDYVSTRTRAPKRPLVPMPHTLSEITGPVYGDERIGELDHDLTRQYEGEPLGERIIVHGRLLDQDGKPVRNSLIEIWQANAAGRYRHDGRSPPGAARPQLRRRRSLHDRRPGPLRVHHHQARRLPVEEQPQRLALPAHPLLAVRPRLRDAPGHPDVLPGRPTLLPGPDLQLGSRSEGPRAADLPLRPRPRPFPEWALGYEFDIVLRGREATPMED